MNNTSVQNSIQSTHNRFRFTLKKRNGSVLVIVAASLFALMGFCAISVDYGISVTEKNRLQRTCDAAALAGASALRQTRTGDLAAARATDLAEAKRRAINVAASNGVTLVSDDITPVGTTGAQLRVTKTSPREFLFGAFVGMTDGQVVASALAGRDYVLGMRGVSPLGVTRQTYEEFRPTTQNPAPSTVTLNLIRYSEDNFGPMNQAATTLSVEPNGTRAWPNTTRFDAVALDLRFENSGGSNTLFREDLTTGNREQTVTVGQLVDPLTSSITAQGPRLVDATADRISSNRRIMYIMVGADGYLAANSNPRLNLTTFVPVEVTQVANFRQGNNPRASVTVRFLRMDDPALATTDMTYGESMDDSLMNYLRLLG